MQGEYTQAIKVYLNPQRSRVDSDILARLLADSARGKSASAVIRTALAEHYRLEQTTTPDRDATSDRLTTEVNALNQAVIYSSEVLQRQLQEKHEEAARLRLALVALAYGNGDMQQYALTFAAQCVKSLNEDVSQI